MSAVSVAPISGAITFGSYLADFMAFRARASQGVEGVTPFGANTCSKNRGAGTPDFSFATSAAILQGSAGTKPNLPGGAGMFLPGGLASTFLFATGVSLATDVVVADYDTGAARMRAAIPAAISGKNADDVVEAWVTT